MSASLFVGLFADSSYGDHLPKCRISRSTPKKTDQRALICPVDGPGSSWEPDTPLVIAEEQFDTGEKSFSLNG